jgi:hypothetical protein
MTMIELIMDFSSLVTKSLFLRQLEPYLILSAIPTDPLLLSWVSKIPVE